MSLEKIHRVFFGTLRRQLICGVAVVHAIMMALFIGDLTKRHEEFLLDRQAEQATALAYTLATSAGGWLAASDISGLQELVESQRRYPELKFAMLLDRRGQVLAHTEFSRVGQFVSDLPALAQPTTLIRSHNLVDVFAPVMLSYRHVGWARVGIGQQLAGQRLAEISRAGLFYAVAAILFGSSIAWFMGRRFTRRLYLINKTIEKVGDGDLGARSSIVGIDEVAVLGNGFNHMLDALEGLNSKLRSSEERFRALFEDSPVSIWEEDFSAVKALLDGLKEQGVVDLDAYLQKHPEVELQCAAAVRIIDVNCATLELQYAADKNELFQDLSRTFTAESFVTFRQELKALWNGETYLVRDSVIRRLDGSLRYVTVYFSVCPGYEQTFSKVLVSLIDITERIHAAVAIQAAAREWSASFDAMSDGISIHHVDYTILNANQALLQLLGKSADEVIGRKCYQVFHGTEQPIAGCPVNKTIITGEKAFSEMFEANLDKWLSVSASQVTDTAGGETRIVHTVRDISEHRKLEEQLRQSQKMESIGTLAGGIAHDFNNILTAIFGYGEITLMKMSADDPLRHNVECMLQGANRAASLTQQLLLFSRKQASDRKQLDLNEVVVKVENFLKKVIGEDIAYNTLVHETPLPVLADEHQLGQVLMNLATNARDAMPEGGAVTVTTSNVNLDAEFRAVHGFGKPGSYALLTVTDNGEGMEQETRQRIFEPFFTTKEVGRGTGLGLAVVYGIVKQHDGYINVYSEPGKGSTFRIYLPISVSEREEICRVEHEETVKGGIETILLAEDDEMVRSLVKSILIEFGYKVIEAVDGADAVQRFAEHGTTVDLLLLDLIMPKMNGKEALDEIRKIRPGISAILSSGYTPDKIQQKVSLTEGVHLITKPISPTELLLKVRKVLDGTA